MSYALILVGYVIFSLGLYILIYRTKPINKIDYLIVLIMPIVTIIAIMVVSLLSLGFGILFIAALLLSLVKGDLKWVF